MGKGRQLTSVLRLIDAGMPCCALAVAEALGVQFNDDTLERWYSERWRDRVTYAWLARQNGALARS